MALPRDKVKSAIAQAVDVASRRVLERSGELFSSEIASQGNGSSSPFQKLLLPEAKVFSSFERSLSASLGKAFDYIAEAIAEETYGNGRAGHTLTGTLNIETLARIEVIVKRYQQRIGATPDTKKELEELRPFIEGDSVTVERSMKNDVFFVDHDGFENYLEIKTPTPNYDQCASIKTRILTIRAMRFAHSDKVRALAVFPHNPNGLIGNYAWPPLKYFLDPEQDWCARGLKLMGPGLWNFIGNSDDTYEELLDCFYEVSMERKSHLLGLLKIT